MFNANTKQVGGDHYRSKYQVWDWITDMLMPFLPASIIKYVYRWRGKNGLEDIQKAHHYLQKYIEVEVARHTKLSKLTEKFLDSNDVPAKGTVHYRYVGGVSTWQHAASGPRLGRTGCAG